MNAVAQITEGTPSRGRIEYVAEPRIYVVGGGFEYIKMFYNAGFVGARSVEDADVVCFTGGADVDPSFYNEKPLKETHSFLPRDQKEAAIYGACLGLQKPMVGICRGAQFLNVMNGGALWQDVNNHAGPEHPVYDHKRKEWVEGMTSTHHQQMRPTKDALIIASAALSTQKKAEGVIQNVVTPSLSDVEVVWYEDTFSLCFQPHPEFRGGSCQDYFLELFEEYIIPCT